MIYRTYYLSPLGRILLAADDIGLIGVWFEGVFWRISRTYELCF